MFTECVTKNPANLVYVEALLSNLQRKYDNNRKGARFKGFGGKGVLKKAVNSQDWEQVFQLGPELLKTNPWDVPTLRALAHACESRHYNEAELRYLKNALDANPKDIEVNRHCAQSLARMGQFDQAIACWHRIEEMTKGSDEAPRRISELTIQKARTAAGIVDDLDLSPGEKGRAKPPAHPRSGRTPNRPNRPAGQHSAQSASAAGKGDFREPGRHSQLPGPGRAALWRGPPCRRRESLDPGAGRVRQRPERARGARKRSDPARRAQVAVAEKRSASQQTAEAAELAAKLRSDLNRLELEIFNARAQRYPHDQGLKFELGVRLKRAGNHAAAVKYLSQGHADPRVPAGCDFGAGGVLSTPAAVCQGPRVLRGGSRSRPGRSGAEEAGPLSSGRTGPGSEGLGGCREIPFPTGGNGCPLPRRARSAGQGPPDPS